MHHSGLSEREVIGKEFMWLASAAAILDRCLLALSLTEIVPI
jgi:hypothetical protein